MNEAMLYEARAENKVRCNLCNHRCRIREGRRGICGVRENREGTLYTMVYGKVVAEHIDPIEKKPLFNFLPGSRAYSIGTVGCNFRCKHCQNADISQYPHSHGARIIGKDIVRVVVGHEIPHPNTPEHHIAWIELYEVKKENDQVINLGRAAWAPVYSNPNVRFQINQIEDFKAFHALAYCNIHGLWSNILEA